MREKTPYFAERARLSRTHYTGTAKGQKTVWQADGLEVINDDNRHAQMAWERFTDRGQLRGTRYCIRHVCAHPRDPEYFTGDTWRLARAGEWILPLECAICPLTVKTVGSPIRG